MHPRTIVAALLSTAAAVGQVTIPPHSNTYVGYSRGFQFTANTPFLISALELPPDAFVAGSAASFLVRVNGAVALHSIGNTSALIPTSIVVQSGDSVDIIGNWSPIAGAGNFTARNSYSASSGVNAAPYNTLIAGVPHVLRRCGWQWDIGDPTWTAAGGTGTYLAPTSGQMGRILMYTSGGTGTTLATNTVLGQGCGGAFGSFYENFPNTAAFDLSNTTITWFPAGTGYIVLGGIPTAFVPPTPAAQVVANGALDGQQLFTLSQQMPLLNGTTNTLNVCTKGYIAPAAGNGIDFTPTPAELLAFPQTTWACWHDYNQSAAGSGPITFEEIGGIAYATWANVYSWNSTSANTMQFQFNLTTGAVTLVIGAFGTGSTYPVVVGFSPGGQSLDPGPTDLSAALAAGAIVLTVPESMPLALAATTRPVINTAWDLTVSQIPASGVFGALVFGLADPNIPDLAGAGMPGCGLRATPDFLLPFVVSGTVHNGSLGLPDSSTLLGVDLYTTAAVFQVPPINAFGAITANGIKGGIGDY